MGNTVLQESVPNEMRATTTAFSNMCSAMIGLGCGPTAVVLVDALLGGGSDGASLRIAIAIVCTVAAVGSLALLHRPSPMSSAAPLTAA